ISSDRTDLLDLLLKRSRALKTPPPPGVLSYAIDGGHAGCLDLLLQFGHSVSPSDLLFAARAWVTADSAIVDDGASSTPEESSFRHAEATAAAARVLVTLAQKAEGECAEQAIVMAVQAGDRRSVTRLLDVASAQATPPAPSVVTDAAITGAVLLGDAETLYLLVTHRAHHAAIGFAVAVVNDNDAAPAQQLVPPIALTLAADAGQLPCVKLLLAAGAVPTHSDVYVAAQRGRADIVRRLLAAAGDPDSGDGFSGRLAAAPLELALKRGDRDVLVTLLAGGARAGVSGLTAAVEAGAPPRLLRKLLCAEADMAATMIAESATDTLAVPPRSPAAAVVMGRAIRDCRLGHVETLLAAGLAATAADVYMAARLGYTAIAAALMASAARSRRRPAAAANSDLDDETRVGMARSLEVCLGEPPAAAEEGDKDEDDEDDDELALGTTPLNLAAKEGDMTALRTLLACGVQPSRFAVAVAAASGRADV
ncbi:hypothetical protein HK405_000062, partial [Cladochytrium tenue]